MEEDLLRSVGHSQVLQIKFNDLFHLRIKVFCLIDVRKKKYRNSVNDRVIFSLQCRSSRKNTISVVMIPWTNASYVVD